LFLARSRFSALHSQDWLAWVRIVWMRAISDTTWITERAKALGFDLCGVAAAANFPELAQAQDWLAKGYAGEMKYLADPRRFDPQAALSGIRSVIVCALNYNTPHPRSTDVPDQADANEPCGWVSRYAWGDDYHEALRTKLNVLVAELRQRFDEPFEVRAYADTGPLQERVFAKHAGLGWIAKNTLLLNQSLGSWFFLGAILTTLDLTVSLSAAESPPPDLCGSCTRCIDACPTDALVEPYVLDARRCISYLTIELRGSVPEELREPVGRHVFGCDICQDVCPWNRRAPVTETVDFQPRTFSSTSRKPEAGSKGTEAESLRSGAIPGSVTQSLLLPSLEWLAALSEDEYKAAFRGSAMKRAKWRGLVRNACIALGNAKPVRGTPAGERICALLRRLAFSSDQAISESALWAISRIQ
jgi:epoxyqueuosine reductase